MTTILGVSAYFHDSAICLLRDGEIVAAAEEERFSRLKHDRRFPRLAASWALEEAGLEIGDVDIVAYHEDPWRKLGRLVGTALATAPRGGASFRKAMPISTRRALGLNAILEPELGGRPRQGFVRATHHHSHAAAAFFPSPFADACILTMDGVGEWATTAIGLGEGNRIELLEELRFPHSLGLFYATFTAYAGFRVNSGEFEFMGLAPYGKPRFRDWLLERVIDLKPDGSFRLDLDYFAFQHGRVMYSPRIERELGFAPRGEGEAIGDDHRDLAASVQAVTEIVVSRMAGHAAELTRKKNLVLSGGVALNCVANGKLLREGVFERIWVQPAADDAGSALGAALHAWHEVLGIERRVDDHDAQSGSLLGPRHEADAVAQILDERGLRFERVSEPEERADRISTALDEGRIVGHFSGRMEFGPRALGARSILADARKASMKARINGAVKFRQDFRPFAPAILRDQAAAHFEIDAKAESPYMSFVLPVREASRELIPAVTHVDGSARLQTVDARRSPHLCRILEAFQRRTGVPVLLNTSFNLRGEPVVCRPEEAMRTFAASGIDLLVVEDFIVERDAQDAAILERLAEERQRIETSAAAVDGPSSGRIPEFLFGLLFCLVVVPLGVVLRLCRVDPLHRRILRDGKSYWVAESGRAEKRPR